MDIQEKETLNLYSHTGRAKSCKKDSCYPTLCTDLETTSGKNFVIKFQKKKEKPEIQVQILKVDKISGVWWKMKEIS